MSGLNWLQGRTELAVVIFFFSVGLYIKKYSTRWLYIYRLRGNSRSDERPDLIYIICIVFMLFSCNESCAEIR